MEDIEKMLSDISAKVFPPEPEVDMSKFVSEPKLTQGPEDDDLALT